MTQSGTSASADRSDAYAPTWWPSPGSGGPHPRIAATAGRVEPHPGIIRIRRDHLTQPQSLRPAQGNLGPQEPSALLNPCRVHTPPPPSKTIRGPYAAPDTAPNGFSFHLTGS
ncbi:hypothetical protein GCM10019017_37810 [Streptomyces showdoensis]